MYTFVFTSLVSIFLMCNMLSASEAESSLDFDAAEALLATAKVKDATPSNPWGVSIFLPESLPPLSDGTILSPRVLGLRAEADSTPETIPLARQPSTGFEPIVRCGSLDMETFGMQLLDSLEAESSTPANTAGIEALALPLSEEIGDAASLPLSALTLGRAFSSELLTPLRSTDPSALAEIHEATGLAPGDGGGHIFRSGPYVYTNTLPSIAATAPAPTTSITSRVSDEVVIENGPLGHEIQAEEMSDRFDVHPTCNPLRAMGSPLHPHCCAFCHTPHHPHFVCLTRHCQLMQLDDSIRVTFNRHVQIMNEIYGTHHEFLRWKHLHPQAVLGELAPCIFCQTSHETQMVCQAHHHCLMSLDGEFQRKLAEHINIMDEIYGAHRLLFRATEPATPAVAALPIVSSTPEH